MMRFSLLALAMMSFCFVSPVLKAEEGAKTAEAAEGSVKNVDAEKMTFVLAVGPKGDKEITVTCDKDTKFLTLDGKDAKMADIVKEKAKVKVTHVDGKASKVEAYKCPCG